MTESQKFTGDIIWVAISHILTLLTGLAIFPALTRSFPTELFGVWVQISATVGLLTPILTLHLGTAMIRFLGAEDDKEKRRRVFSAMIWAVFVFSLLTLFISLLLKQNLSIFLFADSKYAFFVPLVFLWASIEALFSLSLSYLRAMGKIKRLSIIQVALAVARMVLIVTLAITGYSLEWIIIYLIIGQVLFLVMVFGMIINEINFTQPYLQGIRNHLLFCIPMMPSGVLLWVISLSDRFFIAHFLSLSEVGIYSASYTLGSLVSLFWMPIAFVLFPIVSKLWEQKELSKVRNYFEYATKLFLTLAIPTAAGLYMISQPLLRILTTAEFIVGEDLVLLIALGTILLGLWQINVYIILLVQQTKWLPFMIGIAALINAGINIVLIPIIGMMGAAISTIASYFVLSAIITVWARSAVSYRIDFKFISKVVLATLMIVFCLRFMQINSALSIILAVIIGAVIFGLGLLLLRAFSIEDRKLIKEILVGLNPRLWRREHLDKQNPPISNEWQEREKKSR